MSSGAYLFLEVSTLALFVLTLWHAWRRGGFAVAELVTAALYGVLLEWGNILLFRTYHYSEDFWIAVGPVPVIIGLCWGLIIYGAMAYTDQLGLPAWAAPFADALWAILLDLAFDAIAIRLKLWTWTIPIDAGYFGVPADNFFAWLFVGLSFSAWTRWVRSRNWRAARKRGLQGSAPIAAFIGLWLGIKLFGLLAAITYPNGMAPGGGLPLFAAATTLFAVIVLVAILRYGVQIRHGIDLIPALARWAMHGYFFGWALLLFFVPSLRLPSMDLPPFLIVVALVLMIVEVLLLAPVVRRDRAIRQQVIVLPAVAQEQRSQLVTVRAQAGYGAGIFRANKK